MIKVERGWVWIKKTDLMEHERFQLENLFTFEVKEFMADEESEPTIVEAFQDDGEWLGIPKMAHVDQKVVSILGEIRCREIGRVLRDDKSDDYGCGDYCFYGIPGRGVGS